MSRLTPISWKDFVSKLASFGFEGPFSGGKHLFMSKGEIDLTIPNPHGSDIGVDLLIRILRQAGVSREEWMKR